MKSLILTIFRHLSAVLDNRVINADYSRVLVLPARSAVPLIYKEIVYI